MLLSSLGSKDRFVINAVRVGREVGRRLADMGFTEGTEGVVVRRGGFGGPMQVRIFEYDLLLRREEAAKVEVSLLASHPHARGHGRHVARHRRRRLFGRGSDAE